MPIRTEEILSLTEFKRDTTKAIARLRRTKEPQTLTINGRASVVVQDASAYQALIDRLAAIEDRIAIEEALLDLKNGEPGIPLDKAFAWLRKRAKARRGGRS